MLTIIFVSLAVALLVVLVVSLTAFSDVAFRAPQQATLLNGRKWSWQVNFMTGRQLRLTWVPVPIAMRIPPSPATPESPSPLPKLWELWTTCERTDHSMR